MALTKPAAARSGRSATLSQVPVAPMAEPEGTEAPARPRGRPPGGGDKAKSSDVAQSLRTAALELFASQNYSTVTIKDIAKATNINTSLIYYYFGSKEELFLDVVEATVEEAFRKFEVISERADTPEETISIWIEIHIIQFVLLQKLAKISLDYASTHDRTERIDKAVRKFYYKESLVLGKAIRAGINSGVFRAVNVSEMTTFISTFLDGALFRGMMFPKFNHRTAIRHMRRVVLAQLRSAGEPAELPLPDAGEA